MCVCSSGYPGDPGRDGVKGPPGSCGPDGEQGQMGMPGNKLFITKNSKKWNLLFCLMLSVSAGTN